MQISSEPTHLRAASTRLERLKAPFAERNKEGLGRYKVLEDPLAVPGLWPCYVYAPTFDEVDGAVGGVVTILSKARKALEHQFGSPKEAQQQSSSVMSNAFGMEGGSNLRLIEAPHVSLCRATPVEKRERSAFAEAARTVAQRTAPFKVSFARFCALVNDHESRIFFAIEVGQGHETLRMLASQLHVALRPFGAQSYYDTGASRSTSRYFASAHLEQGPRTPRFHASFGSIALPLGGDARQRQKRGLDASQIQPRRSSEEVQKIAHEVCHKLDQSLGKDLRDSSLSVTRIVVGLGDTARFLELKDQNG
ncbi:hypothetical protein IE81DRAFT_325311 [Ceraceosorus guamensis]|uniref:U6 snRNA phosphodiesterase 1 n=1 Tax=Ceraceosorus guamensis TaxID=1522189 RepID=A0A316VSU7_9BASI|nr:hypothetical protein IE81DRAFT_325311 [Ceraceosorus guamensis]PWN40709.1 hypothetical protein IE81DRAFT_325311 [Ceraceosorus guamensis]